MKLQNNKKELEAIQELEAAFKKCAALGITFSVMNSDLMFNNKRLRVETSKLALQEERRSSGSYPPIAYSQDVDKSILVSVNTYKSMDSCGGW